MIWPLIVFVLFILLFVIGYFLGIKKGRDLQRASLKRQRSVLGGMFAEQIAPYLPNFPADLKASEARFVGKPVDFIIFKGMDEKNINEVVFVEVKSGKSRLNSTERALRDVIQAKKVRWYEYRTDPDITNSTM